MNQARTSLASTLNLLCAGLLAALAFAPSARASAQLDISPLSLQLPAKSLATAVTLRNAGRKDAAFQAEIFAWSQKDGQEVLTPTRDLFVSPPIFKMARDARQTVRVGRLKPSAPSATEGSYRLILTEIPPEKPQANTIGTLLRISLPLFVPPVKAEPFNTVWTAERSGVGDDLNLAVENQGNTSVHFLRMSLLQADQLVTSRSEAAYVLPGSSKRFSWKGALKLARPGIPLDILVELNNHKTMRQTLDIGVVSIVPTR